MVQRVEGNDIRGLTVGTLRKLIEKIPDHCLVALPFKEDGLMVQGYGVLGVATNKDQSKLFLYHWLPDAIDRQELESS